MGSVHSRYGHLEVISVLLNDGGCSPNLTNNNGSTPLHIAARNGRVYVIELLLNHPEIDVVRGFLKMLSAPS